MGHFQTVFCSPHITLWFHQLDHRYSLCGSHEKCSVLMLSGVDRMSVIAISTDLEKPSQSVLFMLYLLLKGTSCGDNVAVVLGLCCILRITYKTSFTH